LIAGGDGVPGGVRFVADVGDAVGLLRPFLHPRRVEVGFAGARFEPPGDQVDLGHRRRAIGHHALDDLGGVAPAQIARKRDRPVALARHRNHRRALCPLLAKAALNHTLGHTDHP
jgi:hypothetical protein